MHLWRKIVPSAQTETWSELLLAIVDPQRLAVVTLPNKSTQRLEVYCDTAPHAQNWPRALAAV